ncbi:MAG TPA: YARHG domain-containing protein [Nitrospirota bacterium]|nr:YARHG domain-containing protein [Nitrospirota bacterium]
MATLLSFIGLAPAIAFADDGGRPGLYGVTLVPDKTDSIQMVSEEVRIDLRNGTVRCRFVLKNLKDKQQKITVLFPFQPLSPHDLKESFDVLVNDAAQDVTIRDLAPGPSLPFTKEYSKGASWSMTFDRNEEKKVECNYNVSSAVSSVSSSLWYQDSGNPLYDECRSRRRYIESFTFITRTGSLWAGDIEKAEFRIIPTEGMRDSLRNSRGFNAKCINSYVEVKPKDYTSDSSANSLFLTFTRWEPAEDISLRYEDREPDTGGYEIFKYKRYTAHSRLYDLTELVSISWQHAENSSEGWGVPQLDRDYLRYLRNEIYARHGRPVQDQRLNEFFASARWHQPDSTPTPLNAVEEANAANLLALEDALKRLKIHFFSRNYHGDKLSYAKKDHSSFADSSKFVQYVFITLLRNEIYARKGYCFKNPFYAAFFSTTQWYKKNCAQSQIELNDTEKRNAEYLLEIEKSILQEMESSLNR